MLISFVIPVFNEEGSLKILYNEILEHLGDNDYEMIFIDDGSNDESYTILSGLAKQDSKVKIIKFRRNFGKAAALQAGFSRVSGEVVFTMDADLQDNPLEIKNFLNKLDEGYDLVSGWKKKRHDPISKTLPSKLFNKVTSASFNLQLHDYNCGFKAYRRCVVEELDIYGDMHRYIPALAHAKGFRIAEIPVEHRAREFGKSKYGMERFLRGFLDLLTVKLVTGFTSSPLYLFGRIGVSTSLIGVLLGIYLTVSKYLFHQNLSNRPLLFLAILLIMVGIQFFSIGLLGELVVNQTRKQNRKDMISIEKEINLEKDNEK